jgi:predicted AAA+ superfamily ATPase
MKENNLIDLPALIDFQAKEQYKAIMILGPANSGKTKFAKLLAQKIKAKYLDLLDIFSNDEGLSKTVDTFDVSHLKKYLLNLTIDEAVVIADDIDFLINTWSDREKGEFLNLVDKLRSNETKKTFCFFVQEEDILDSKSIFNSRNESRIIHLNQVAHIKETGT